MKFKNTIKSVNRAIDKLSDDLAWIEDELYYLCTTNITPPLNNNEYKRAEKRYKLIKNVRYKINGMDEGCKEITKERKYGKKR